MSQAIEIDPIELALLILEIASETPRPPGSNTELWAKLDKKQQRIWLRAAGAAAAYFEHRLNNSHQVH